ncbi:hypothetical protein S518_004342 [Salmonella enterica subsp. enterica]|nr:hypothetical protein [Salmonella enterica subsp. enterica]
MALLTISREQLTRAATLDTDRQLVHYICDTLAPVLPRIPAQPGQIGPFVRQAGQDAIQRGFGEGGYYGFHILADLLLGPFWERHPFYAGKFEKYLDAPGMEQSARITLALKAVIDTRRALETILPRMIAGALWSLNIHPDLLTPEDVWNAFQRTADARRIAPHHVLPLFEKYETGFRKANGLPPVQRRQLTGNDILAAEAQGLPLPKPSDDIHGLSPLILAQFNGCLQLALIYGPYFSKNPFLAELLRTLEAARQQAVYQHELKSFLLSLQQALTENADG